MDYNNLLWNKIEQSVKEKSANDLLTYAQKEYKELVENKLCEDFYTASEIVDFMRAKDIPFSCRGRLPAYFQVKVVCFYKAKSKRIAKLAILL